MSFISDLPRPFISNEDREEFALDPSGQNNEDFPCQVKFLNYSVTSDNVQLLCRDLSLPFEYLKSLANMIPIDLVDSDPAASICSSKILAKKAKLTGIKLKILNRAEKSQSLSNMPILIAGSLEGMSFNFFLEILPTFTDVLSTWVEGVQKKQNRKKRTKFYATPRIKHFDIEKLTTELERIFLEGLYFYNRPNFSDLTYYEFQKFLDMYSIPYAGPYKSSFNGQNLVSVFVLGKAYCLRFFNNNFPLYGIFEFEPTPQIEKYENLPKWFLDPPTINNFSINQMISDFQRMSFV